MTNAILYLLAIDIFIFFWGYTWWEIHEAKIWDGDQRKWLTQEEFDELEKKWTIEIKKTLQNDKD